VDPVHEYFQAIRTRDADTLRALFTDDAELMTVTGTYTGPDAIASFYRDLVFKIDDLWPEPGELIVDGDRVAVEIALRMNGKTTMVADVFVLTAERDKIRRIAIYPGPQVQGIDAQRGQPSA
jgi:ketosteroid isomerase-like protein